MAIHKDNFELFLHSAYRVVSNIKEVGELTTFKNDLLEIRWLLANCYENDSRVFFKREELNYRYGRYMSSYMRFVCSQLTNLGKLEFYLQNLLQFEILKFSANRVTNLLCEKLFFGYIK